MLPFLSSYGREAAWCCRTTHGLVVKLQRSWLRCWENGVPQIYILDRVHIPFGEDINHPSLDLSGLVCSTGLNQFCGNLSEVTSVRGSGLSHICMCIYICMYVCTYVCTYVRTYIHTYIHTYLPTYVRTYVRTYIHTYIHTYICICIYMCVY